MFSFPAAICYLLCALCHQDPTVVAPAAYRNQFENRWVKVVRAHYEPREKIASHDHPANNTVYVYLGDSGPVRFKHTGHESFQAERPPVRAGGFRLGAAVKETHEIESLSDQPTDFLRVELKTEAADKKTFKGRYPPDDHRTDYSSQRVRFENAQVRISSLTCAARAQCGDATRQDRPSLLVAITEGRLRIAERDGGPNNLSLAPGQTIWKDAGEPIQMENAGGRALELLRIEFKTAPAGFAQ
jgi:hypothetical protein